MVPFTLCLRVAECSEEMGFVAHGQHCGKIHTHSGKPALYKCKIVPSFFLMVMTDMMLVMVVNARFYFLLDAF